MARKITTDEIIKRFKEIHGDKYDYSEFEYVNAITKGKIICPKHGEFWQSSNVHLRGVRCPLCARENVNRSCYKLSKEDVLERAIIKHNDKYEYDLSNFKDSSSNILIKCPIHGWFEQNVTRHLHGQGCPQCGNDAKREKMTISLDEIIIRFKNLHGDKYDYSKFEYKNCWTKSIIICPIHGEFLQSSNMHLLGHGCPKCVGRSRTKEDFIKEAREVHGDNYDYSLVEYTTAETKVQIKCNKCGAIFWQKPWSHLQRHGCPNCQFSKGEMLTEKLLKDNNIKYETQKRFDWLGHQSLDFYLPDYNIAIEYQGEQHFGTGGWCDEVGYKKIRQRDILKYNTCKENGIDILYFTKEKNIPTEYIGELYTNEEDLINKIKFN